MFIDFLSLLLLNMVAGFVLLAAYLYFGLEDCNRRRWAPGFLMVGLIALVFGGRIVMTWPLPGVFNMAYGEPSVWFGIVFLGAGVCLSLGWSLLTVAGYAFFMGLASMVIGARIINLGLTPIPLLPGAGFLLTGLAAVMAAPTLLWLRHYRVARVLGVLLLLLIALIWAATAYPEYWMHFEAFSKWQPR